MSETPLIKGLNAKVTFQLAQPNGTTVPFIVQATNIDIEPDKTAIADDIIGRKRSSLDSVLNFYKVTMQLLLRDMKLLKGILAYEREKNLLVVMASSGMGILIQPNDGTRAGFSLVEYTLDDWKWNISGRSDRQKLTVPGRCEDMVDLPTIT